MIRIALTHPLHLIIGLALWCLWFVAIYSGLSVACAVAPPAPESGALTAINVSLGLLTAVTVALLAWLAVACLRAARRSAGLARFVAGVSAGLYLYSAIGVLFVGIPVIGVPPCL